MMQCITRRQYQEIKKGLMEEVARKVAALEELYGGPLDGDSEDDAGLPIKTKKVSGKRKGRGKEVEKVSCRQCVQDILHRSEEPLSIREIYSRSRKGSHQFSENGIRQAVIKMRDADAVRVARPASGPNEPALFALA